MKKHKGMVLWRIIQAHPDFTEIIQEVRKRNQIPPQGFTFGELNRHFATLSTNRMYRLEGDIELVSELISKDNQILKEEADFVQTAMNMYVLHEEKAFEAIFFDKRNAIIGCEIWYRLPPKKYQGRFKNGIFLYLSPHATQQDVRRALHLNWNDIQETFEIRGVKPKRLRERSNLKRDQEIFSLMSKSRTQLGLKRGEYKHIATAKIISKKYHPISSDTVKSIYQRIRKQQKDLRK